MTDLTTIDRIAMYVGGGLLLIGVFLIGLLDMFLGSGHPVGSDGAIEHNAIIPLEVRSYIMLAGLLIMGLYAVYKVVATTPAVDTESTGAAAGTQD